MGVGVVRGVVRGFRSAGKDWDVLGVTIIRVSEVAGHSLYPNLGELLSSIYQRDPVKAKPNVRAILKASATTWRAYG